jgi:hypothetical protein
MSQTINRLYDSLERANQVAGVLRSNRRVRFDQVHVVGRYAGGGAERSVDDIVAALMTAYVLKAHARVFAPRIQQGGAMVIVHAPFGTAMVAQSILDQHGPIDSGVAEARDKPLLWDDAAPCSSALRLRVLLPDSATFARFWNVPPLAKRGATTSSALGLPEVSDSRGPFTGSFPLPLLSNKGAIFSAALGLPLLLRPRGASR